MHTLVPRLLKESIFKAAAFFPIITINGPRQSGKTTLTKMMFPEKEYVNLENLDIRSFALNDPRGFLHQFSHGAIIDEIQNVPSLLSYIQAQTDENNIPGQYILTGSNNLLLNQHISQSLAGRTALFTLLPFSLAELNLANSYKITNYDDLCLHGFYPRLWKNEYNYYEYYLTYIATYIERDLRNLLQVKNLTKFQHFLELCAGRIGSILNKASLSSDLGISEPTIEEWLSILEAGFIINRMKPYSKQIGKRLIKSPKIYFTDVGIVCALLGIKSSEHLKNHPLRGLIFENLIIMEIYKYYLNTNNKVNLSFYRDQVGNEIDLLIEDGANLSMIEIKSGQTFSESFTKTINIIKPLLTNSAKCKPIIFYAGEAEITTSNGIEIKNILKTDLTTVL